MYHWEKVNVSSRYVALKRRTADFLRGKESLFYLAVEITNENQWMLRAAVLRSSLTSSTGQRSVGSCGLRSTGSRQCLKYSPVYLGE